MDLKYCPKCGGELDVDAKFCNFCGADLRDRIPKEQVQAPTVLKVPPKQQVSTPTPQATPISEKQSSTGVEYANLGSRFVALIIDAIIIVIITGVLSYRLPLYLSNIIGYGIALFYFWILEAYNNGRTLGKMALSLRTVNAQTLDTAKPGEYLINNLLKSHFVLFLVDFFIGILVNSGDPQKKRRFMQNASNTVVIKVRK
jgi:uncharacterized RDD family membrane protein YckC